MTLLSYGWSHDWQKLISIGETPARIMSIHRSHIEAICEEGSINLYLPGRLQLGGESLEDLPAVGDWVVVSPAFIDEQNKLAAMVIRVLPRQSRISRMQPGTGSQIQILAANIDYAFIVSSANGDLSARRMQRYALLAEEGNVTPVLILSKVDLLPDYSAILRDWKSAVPNAEIIAVSALKNIGKENFKNFLKPGMTSVFLGSSGVGKSSLTNWLLGKPVQEVQSVREDDDKGRHTTTARELFLIPEQGIIIDTPGLREVQIHGSEDNVNSVFGDLSDLFDRCRFKDCQHKEEPGCAVKTALESGELSRDHWESYEKLQREAHHARVKIDKRLASEQKNKWKTIHKNVRAKKKFEGKI